MAGTSTHVEHTESLLSHNGQLATFRIGEELFGLGINTIREIVRYPEITAVPRSPAYLTGLANMRGNVLPVVDARIRLGVKAKPITDVTRVLVIEMNGYTTGLIVDVVCGVMSLEAVAVEAPPSLLTSGVDTRYVRSVIKADGGRKIIMEIDAEALCLTDASGALVTDTSRDRGALTTTDKTESVVVHDEIQLVTFLVANEEYAFPIESVREVLRIGKITEVPDVAPYLLGILTVRNALLPVVDIRKLFGLPSLVDGLSLELDSVKRYGRHLAAAFSQYMLNKGTWNADSTVSAVLSWLDSLRSSSEVLGRHYQGLRTLFQKLSSSMGADSRDQLRQLEQLSMDKKRIHLAEVDALLTQLDLRIDECKALLGKEIQEDQRILVIEIGRMPVGILVDRMQQVVRLSAKNIDQPPALLHTEAASSLKGIVKLQDGARIIMVIDQERMLKSEALAGLGASSFNDEAILAETTSTLRDSIQLVTFCLGDEEFGVSIEDVQEINRFEHITTVPRAPSFVEGVMNLRGNVIPAIDLRKRFGMEPAEHDESTRVIIVTMNGKLSGLIVDSVSEVFRMDRNTIEPPPSVIKSDLNMDFIKGICKDSHNGDKMIVLIETSRLLRHEEQQQLSEVLTVAGIEPPKQEQGQPSAARTGDRVEQREAVSKLPSTSQTTLGASPALLESNEPGVMVQNSESVMNTTEKTVICEGVDEIPLLLNSSDVVLPASCVDIETLLEVPSVGNIQVSSATVSDVSLEQNPTLHFEDAAKPEETVTPLVESLKVESLKVESPKVESPKVESPNVESPNVESPKKAISGKRLKRA